jgi:4'-phosphopantetheinyl transferase
MEWQCVNKNLEKLILNNNLAQIWAFDLDKIHLAVNLFYSFLSDDEIIRANKFRNQIDKNRFICAKGILRYLIYIQTKINPSSIKFSYGKYKKPALEEGQNQNLLKFNISHCKGVFCIGMVNDLDIGIDIELIRPIPDFLGLVKKYFSETEFRQIEKLSGESSLEAFYKLWTSKEAIMKLVGKGLSLPLSNFEILINSNGKININNPRKGVQNHLDKIYLESFIIDKDIIGTLAMNTKVNEILYFKVEKFNDLIKKLEKLA